jgi:hypothetical protein
MRHDDVKKGHVYLTRVGGELAPVRVLYEMTVTRYGYRTGLQRRRVFRVARYDGAVLPKPRSAAALRPTSWDHCVPCCKPTETRFDHDGNGFCYDCRQQKSGNHLM